MKRNNAFESTLRGFQVLFHTSMKYALLKNSPNWPKLWLSDPVSHPIIIYKIQLALNITIEMLSEPVRHAYHCNDVVINWFTLKPCNRCSADRLGLFNFFSWTKEDGVSLSQDFHRTELPKLFFCSATYKEFGDDILLGKVIVLTLAEIRSAIFFYQIGETKKKNSHKISRKANTHHTPDGLHKKLGTKSSPKKKKKRFWGFSNTLAEKEKAYKIIHRMEIFFLSSNKWCVTRFMKLETLHISHDPCLTSLGLAWLRNTAVLRVHARNKETLRGSQNRDDQSNVSGFRSTAVPVLSWRDEKKPRIFPYLSVKNECL